MLKRRLEELSLNAWPALEQILFDGWILRFSKGYTKRANSVNPFFTSTMDVEEKVSACERIYTEKGLPTVFRLTPFSSPPGLDQVLSDRNYETVAPTLVLHRGLKGLDFRPAPSVELRNVSLDEWLDAFCGLGESPREMHQAHREILASIPSSRFLALLVSAGQPVACGLGVLENGYLGLFDLLTDARQRSKGYGTALVAGLLKWAQDSGAQHAYLQVVRRNEVARRLYAKFGFEEAYHYWYRVPPE